MSKTSRENKKKSQKQISPNAQPLSQKQANVTNAGSMDNHIQQNNIAKHL